MDGGSIEVWRVLPDGPSRGTILFMHGWGRNRDRMVGRARIFARWGFTTVMHSARDHGHSSPSRMMNIMKFGEDIETVLHWLDEPVMLYGHSAGSGGALIAAVRNPEKIQLLFLEGVFAETREALMHLYIWASPIFRSLLRSDDSVLDEPLLPGTAASDDTLPPGKGYHDAGHADSWRKRPPFPRALCPPTKSLFHFCSRDTLCRPGGRPQCVFRHTGVYPRHPGISRASWRSGPCRGHIED